MRVHLMPVVLLGLTAALAGCAVPPPAAQPESALPANALRADAGRVGVAMSPAPRADTEFPGAGRLWCLAVASIAHGPLTDHVRTLSPHDLPALKDRAAALLRARGAEPVILPEPLDLRALAPAASDAAAAPDAAPRQDFRPLKSRHQIDKLLVIDIKSLGVARRYSRCVADGEPQVVFNGTIYLVDLKTNALEWRHAVHLAQAGDASWDEWPKYPHLDAAFFKTLQMGKEELLRPLR